jgi:hypothetical protein
MKTIHITRNGNVVTFEPVSIDVTENVFFQNLDRQAAHWPWFRKTDDSPEKPFATNQVGAAPSLNSSQCTVPTPQPPPPPSGYQVTYGCKIAGHENEQGVISVFGQLQSIGDPGAPISLHPATQNVPIPRQQLVSGGKSPYRVSEKIFQITAGTPPTVIQSDKDSIGPGLQLSPTDDNTGVWVTGTPTVVGTYHFTFVVDDGMGKNLQQVQYFMVVGKA